MKASSSKFLKASLTTASPQLEIRPPPPPPPSTSSLGISVTFRRAEGCEGLQGLFAPFLRPRRGFGGGGSKAFGELLTV